MKLNHLLIPAAVVSVAVLGSIFTRGGMSWYRTLKLLSWTPPGSTIGLVWTVIFALSAASLLLVFNGGHAAQALRPILRVALLNAALNVLWSLLFFGFHRLGAATFEAALLGATVVWLMVLVWPLSRLASLLLAPYAAWVAFATYLAYSVWRLNR
jgi:tryptophan-rich sensory protein